MRQVDFGPIDSLPAVELALKQIEHASREDAMLIADDFSVTGFTATYTLNAGTATAADVANFVATFIDQLQRRGRQSD